MTTGEQSIFSDLHIVELASVLAGPSVGMFFAELGAKVIKVENPVKGGDVTRHWRSKGEDASLPQSAYYSSVNWGKEVKMLDLKDPTQYSELCTLIKNADIVISNYLPRVAQALQVDYDTIKSINEQVIFANISGYGPDADRPAFDVILQAESGFMSMNGSADGPPTKMPVALIDILAAHHLKQGVLVALLKRFKTGKGSRVDVSLRDAAIASLANQATNYLMNGQVPQRMGSQHPNIAPYGDMFKTKDDRWIITAIGNEHQFLHFCQIIQADSLLSDERFKTNTLRVTHRNELCNTIQFYVGQIDSATLLEMAFEENVPITAINMLDAVFSSDDAQSLILKKEVNGQMTKCVKTKIFSIL